MTELTQLSHIQESLNAIGQNLERLVCHFAGSERDSTSSDRDGKRNSFVSGEATNLWCIRAQENPRVWGPFQTRQQAWLWLHKKINEKIIYQDIEKGTIHYETGGHFTIEALYTKEALAFA